MENDKPTILLIGETSTGKTNYISRLWLAIKSEDYSLRLSSLPENIDYIQNNANVLLKGNFVGHTSRGIVNEIIIPISLKNNTENGDLIIPDLSGEDLSSAFYQRSWDERIEQVIENCVGVILFIRMNRLHNPANWLDLGSLLGPEKLTNDERTEILKGIGIDLDNLKPPTQTNMVEWLQFINDGINEIHGIQKKIRVAIMIAAWDEIGVEFTERGPENFLANHTPLLDSFIRSNEELIDFKVFGVSVVGGNLNNDPDFKKNYLEGNPHKQGYILYVLKNKIIKDSDVTLPVAWILGHSFEESVNEK